MKPRIDKRRAALLTVFFVLALCVLAGCGTKDRGAVTSIEQLGEPGRRIGLEINCPEEKLLVKDFPEAQLKYYSDIHLAYADVAAGRLDAVVSGRMPMELAIKNGRTGVRLLNDDYTNNIIKVGISPLTSIPDFTKKLNTFIAELKSDGTLDDMYDRWVIQLEQTMPEIVLPDDPSFNLRVGTTGTVQPYTYYVGTELYGYDIELAYRFAAWLGAGLEFKVYDFGGIITAARSGDIDCIMSNLYYSPEISESIPFSDTLFEVPIAFMVRDTGADTARTDAAIEHAAVGALNGSNFADIMQEYLPDAEFRYFNTVADQLIALKSGKIEAFVLDEPVARSVQAEDNSVKIYPEKYGSFDYAYIMTKNERGAALNEELSGYIRALKDNGTMDALQKKWFDCADLTSVESTDYRRLPDVNGTIRLATLQYQPFVLNVDGLYRGYEIEILAMFCRDNGYALEISEMNFDAILPSVESGKCDIGCGSISVTDERKEVILFSEPDYSGGLALLVLKDGGDKESDGFWSGILDSFQKTFIRESRWKLFLEGVGTTLLITALAILFGTVLGFFVFMLCRSGNPAANAITRFCVWLVQGMPVVVLLMILYYIVFGKVAISGTTVSIIGFTLIFASAVYAMLRAGVGAVDKGQTEAAYALGYSDRRTFYRIVLPQALPHFMPAYKSEITALIKATAVVGYVAVQDLTKVGDIIRSRTYEAFFPLIAVAVIYFVLAAILIFIVNKIEIHIDPRRRSRDDILKGVQIK